MWARVTLVPFGNPVNVATTSTVPAVMSPAASLVTLIVTVAVPLPPSSAFPAANAGTSLSADNAAVNTSLVGCVGDGLTGVVAAAPGGDESENDRNKRETGHGHVLLVRRKRGHS